MTCKMTRDTEALFLHHLLTLIQTEMETAEEQGAATSLPTKTRGEVPVEFLPGDTALKKKKKKVTTSENKP